MPNVFINVPHQHVGSPISIKEAVERIEGLAEAPGFSVMLTLEGSISAVAGSWLFLKSGLQAGAVDSFIQPTLGRWYSKIPAEYWRQFGPNTDFSDVFAGMSDSKGIGPEAIGQPIVIWDDGMSILLDVLAKSAKVVREIEAGEVPARPLPSLEYSEGADGPFGRSSSWADISAWYRWYVTDAPEEGYTREEDERAGRAVGIGRERMRELRREYAPATWSKDGPKRRTI